ncbi:Thioesterase superfamily protein [Candidatus Zixiibacteriota bacterium]|nr:Thioesterase superfamily protein [candidate division Zixibacteria bacterium]
MQEIARYSGCFVCGDKNQIGLQARFYFREDKAISEYTAQKNFEGYSGVLHGGITAALMDEVMIKALLARGIFAMTVELTVNFHKAVVVGQKLLLEGSVDKEKGRLFVTKGEARFENGEIAATASGKYLQVREEMKVILTKSLDS